MNMNIKHKNMNNTSFSSSLLEEIYRSFDEDKDRDSHSRRTRITKGNRKSTGFYDDFIEREKKHNQLFKSRDEIDRYVLEQWLDNEKEKVAKFRRNSMPENGDANSATKFRRNSLPEDGSSFRRPFYSSASTSSSDSSSGIGGFSSSDTDSLYGAPARMIKPKITSLKPIRTAVSSPEYSRKSYSGETPARKNKKDGKFLNALKLYGELKKVKQPISPGGKFACFLNSLFHSGNSKKAKIEMMTSSSPAMTSMSVPSTATSYSRSCLSKTPSSAGRFDRRSVRFCPVNVVVDEMGQRSVYNEEVSIGHNGEELQAKILEKQKRVEEVAKELLKNYRSNNNLIRKELIKVNVISANHGNSCGNNNSNINNYDMQGSEDEDEDDDESCCSSDLFELDNLMEIGVDDRYCQELPVYETTHIRTNRAIANGMMV